MTIKDKAKAYDEALERARKINSGEGVAAPSGWTVCETIFPELKESEDERIRNGLIGYFRAGKCENVSSYHGISTTDIISWLEKQVEKKPADKVEPKFKVGDKVLVDGKVYTIKLVNEDNYIINKNGRDIQLHFSYTKDWKLYEQKPVEWNKENERMLRAIIVAIDIISKEKGHDYCYIKDNSGKIFVNDIKNWLKSLKDRALPQPKQEWSKEDKRMFDYALDMIEWYSVVDKSKSKRVSDWLKSIKDRVQPKQEWSEEDSPYYDDICEFLINLLHSETANINKNAVQKDLDWLKSLSPQKQWKPSEEQMGAFEHFVRSIGESGYASPYDNNTKLLYSLLSDLKKLKEE